MTTLENNLKNRCAIFIEIKTNKPNTNPATDSEADSDSELAPEIVNPEIPTHNPFDLLSCGGSWSGRGGNWGGDNKYYKKYYTKYYSNSYQPYYDSYKTYDDYYFNLSLYS